MFASIPVEVQCCADFTGDGSVLHTLVLRPTVMYGELDPWYVVSGLRAAQRHGGILLPVGDGTARMQVSYAGNVAWAHLCAAETYLCTLISTVVHLYIRVLDSPETCVI